MNNRFFIRRNKIRRSLIHRQFDAILISNPINVRYLTGFTGNDAYLMIKNSGDIILSDPRFTIQIEEECSGLETYLRSVNEPLMHAVGKVLGKTTSGTLGIEAESLTLAKRDRLAQVIPAWQIVTTQNIVEELRQIKDRNEIQLIRKAIDLAYRSFRSICASLSPEQTELDIRNNLEYQMRLHGAEDKSFPSIIGVGSRAALPHGSPSLLKLAGQSHLLIDWGTIVNGYMSDLTRVLIFQKKDKKLRTVYETVLKAQNAAIKAIKPGKNCNEIDAIARAVISDAGFGKYFDHGLGHSFGLEIHESPRFVGGDHTILKPGMILTVEPGIYLKDWGGVRIEDDILVTKTGCEVLSDFVPKSFDEMFYSIQ
ncbi:MAG: Xaa-Pro peptidase family protein [Planctomycetaceae bacterium]|jgi:Xaa-Pro aminopeptidase|nr:Xaa-Pro peptidase family protein [Planctomycetaceae bacterium]